MVVSCKSYLWYWCIWMCLNLLFQDRFYRNSVLWLAFVEVNFTSSPFAYGSVPNFILEDTLRPNTIWRLGPLTVSSFWFVWCCQSHVLSELYIHEFWDGMQMIEMIVEDVPMEHLISSYLVLDVSQKGSNNLGKSSCFLHVLYFWLTDSTGPVSCLFDWKIVHLLEFCWGEALLVQATMWRSFNLLWLQMMYWMSIGVSP